MSGEQEAGTTAQGNTEAAPEAGSTQTVDTTAAAASAPGNGGDQAAPSGEQTAEQQQAAAQTQEGDAIEYQDFSMPELPENMAVDQPLLDSFKAFAAERQLSQEDAQAYVDFYAENAIGNHNKAVEEHEARVAQWRADSENDSEYGGEKYEASVANATKVLDRFATPELREFLDETGFGNHPELIRFAVRIGAAFSEDDSFSAAAQATGAGDTGEKSQAEVLYPGQS